MTLPSGPQPKVPAVAESADAAAGDLEEAERVLAAATAPLVASRSMSVPIMQLAAAVVMTAAGAGVALVASSSALAQVAAGVCAPVVAARVVGLPMARWRRHRAGEPEWVAAAAVHERSWPGRVPAATLAAVARYLPVLAAARGLDGAGYMWAAARTRVSIPGCVRRPGCGSRAGG
jgi:hypothetical protein